MAAITGTNDNDDDITNPALVGTLDADVIKGLLGNDLLFGGTGDDSLFGGGGTDTLYGEEGNDTLVYEALVDSDTFDGGADIDTFLIIPQSAGVQDLTLCTFVNLEIMNAGFQSAIINPGQLDLFDVISNIGIIYHDFSGTSDLSNKIASGEAGHFVGASGRDVFSIAGADTGWYLRGLAGNDRITGGEGADTIEGGDGDDLLFGRGGDDTLVGDHGDDDLRGGNGDDLFQIKFSGNGLNPFADQINGGNGTDSVLNNTFGAYRMEASTYVSVEILIAGSVYANAGQLEQFADIQNLAGFTAVTAGTTDLTGRVSSFNFGSFSFNGTSGDDTLIISDAVGRVQIGSSGGDDVAYSGAFDDRMIGGDGQNLFDAGGGDDSLDGRGGNDTLFGRGGDDTLIGGSGDDILIGGAGADMLNGFTGRDMASYEDAGSGVTAALANAAANTGDAAGDSYLYIDDLLGSAYNDDLRGNSDDNLLRGGAGNDTLTGQAGKDRLIGDGGADLLNGGGKKDVLKGGWGQDILIGGSGNDVLDGGGGSDLADYSGAGAVTVDLNITVGQATGRGKDKLKNIENLLGGDGDDVLTGNDHANWLDGGAGADTLTGGADADVLHGGLGNDLLIGGSGNDNLDGGGGNDILQGNWGGDLLQGGWGADTLSGGAAKDTLTGGAGADVFLFQTLGDSGVGFANRDLITDFQQGIDLIDLSAIDAISGGGNQAFSFIGSAGFSGAAGELRSVQSGSKTLISADVDGDGAADFQLQLSGLMTVVQSDFIL